MAKNFFATNLNEEPEQPTTTNVKKSTFIRWDFATDIEILEMDQNTNIHQIRCKVCHRHKEALLRQADALGLRGVAKDGIVKYANGLVFTVLKTNIRGHVAGTLHTWAVQNLEPTRQMLTSPTPSGQSSANEACSSTPQMKKKHQKTLEASALSEAAL